MNILAADLIRYNANNRGTYTGDCTARAISLAFNMDYHKARKLLNDSARENWRLNWQYNSTNNVKKVIEKLGGGKAAILVGREYTVNSFADSHNQGTYILHCNDNGKEGGPGGHLVTIIDGKVYDSWDSRNCYVLTYHRIDSGIRGEDITDVGEYLAQFFKSMTSQGLISYANNVFDTVVDKNKKLKKLSDEYGVDISLSLSVRKAVFKDYVFKFVYSVSVDIPSYNIYNSSYSSKFGITFSPTMTPDQVEPSFNARFYTKIYDFVNSIVKKIEDTCDGYRLIEQNREGITIPDRLRYQYDRWDSATEKSFNALPYWVRRLTKWFSRRSPFEGGDYDSVELTIYTPPFDTKYGQATENTVDPDTRYFHAYNMNDLMRGLQHYRVTGDYDEAYLIAGDY